MKNYVSLLSSQLHITLEESRELYFRINLCCSPLLVVGANHPEDVKHIKAWLQMVKLG